MTTLASPFTHGGLREALEEIPCPYRLFPPRMVALGLLTGTDPVGEVREVITVPLAGIAGQDYAEQFERDLRTYGLYEAILYFHDYQLPESAAPFVKVAIALYHAIAGAYVQHHDELADSDDPRIQAQLLQLRHFGDSRHAMPGFRGKRPAARPKIEPPAEPSDDPDYRRQRPIHSQLRQMTRAMGWSDEKPGSAVVEAMEHLGAYFTFESSPALATLFQEIAGFLRQFGVDPFGAHGQFAIQAMCVQLRADIFGDFDRWTSCLTCEENFKPAVTLEEGNAVLITGGWQCPDCRSAATSAE